MSYDIGSIPSDFQLTNPYEEFDFKIIAGGRYTIKYNFTFVQMLELSTNAGVELIFGDRGGNGSKISGAGIGFQLPNNAISDRLTIVNKTSGIVTGKVALAIGKISDNRLSVSGTVVTRWEQSKFVNVEREILSNVKRLIAVNESNRKSLILTNDSSANIVAYGDFSNLSISNCSLLYPKQTIIIDETGEIGAFTFSGTTPLYIGKIVYV